ncbi:MAG TPA: mechanosensitive ion channel family protein [Candidatus Kapabacteria bacterium]|nr:mechanosensitive ion channel family protein [Candidatus Kapabacteria bacterium]HPO62450.1 mechanosensitive ion channel family protein [Candidatus Kapabacteria bacterium]
MKKIIILLLLLLVSEYIFAETDTNSNSSSTAMLELKRQSDSSRIADSVRYLKMLEEINKLKENEKDKRAALEKEFNDFKREDSIRKAISNLQIDSLIKATPAFPVVPFGDTLFLIYSKVASFSAKERAEAITNRIIALEENFDSEKDTIKVILNEETADIICNELLIMSIWNLDALFARSSKEELAKKYSELIFQAIDDYLEGRSWLTILKQIGFVLIVIIAIFYLLKLVTWSFKKIYNFAKTNKTKYLKDIHIKGYVLLNVEREFKIILLVLKLLKYFSYALILYISLPVIFSIFPVTKSIAYTLFDYFLNPIEKVYKAVVGYIPNLITIIVMVFIGKYSLKFLKYLANEVESGNLEIKGFYADWVKPTYNIVRVLLIAFIFIMIFPYLPGSDSAIFQGVSVFLGIIVSIGSSSVIGNMIAGIVITYMRPFKIGDRVKIADVTGDVIEKTPFVIRIRTPKNEEITIPNSTILSSHTTNYSNNKEGLILHTTVTIGYDVPWRAVEQLLIEAAKNTNDICESPAPFVLQTSLDDFYIAYQLNAYTKEASKQAGIYSELHQNIQDSFRRGNVEIMSPHYRAIRDGNEITIPKE